MDVKYLVIVKILSDTITDRALEMACAGTAFTRAFMEVQFSLTYKLGFPIVSKLQIYFNAFKGDVRELRNRMSTL